MVMEVKRRQSADKPANMSSRILKRRRHAPQSVIQNPMTWKLCMFIVSIPVVALYVGYSIGNYLMPPARKFPDRGIVADIGRLNYTLYNTHNVTVDFIGGLGNHMFQYASLYGIAKANGLKPVVTTDNRLLDIFPNLKAQFVISPTVFSTYSRFNEFSPSSFDGRTFSLNFERNIRLEGFFQSWRYFDHIRADIKKQFAFHKHVTKKVNNRLSDIYKVYTERVSQHNIDTANPVQIVGVHIRRGDTMDMHNAVKGYTVADVEYINTAISYFQVLYKNVIFIVCTDDEPWARANVKTDSSTSLVVLSPFLDDSPVYDLCLLSLCNHTIVTVGTFGWWGAWLAGGDAVYYRAYPKPYSDLARHFSYADYFSPKWIPL